MQKAAFMNFRDDMQKFVLSNVAAVDTRGTLSKHLRALSRDQLCKLACNLNLIPEPEGEQDKRHKQTYSKDFLMDLMVSHDVIRVNGSEIYMY